MKVFFTFILLVLTSSVFCQRRNKQTTYASITGQFGIYKNDGNLYGGSIQAGSKLDKVVGLGVGVDVLKFKNVSGPYIPAYADFRFFLHPAKKTQIFFMAQPGYGIYSHDYTVSSNGLIGTTSGKGGFYAGGGFGLQGRGKGQPIITFRYCSYDFEYKYSGNIFGSSYEQNSRTGAFVINAGITF
jgi:hypothetical protein